MPLSLSRLFYINSHFIIFHAYMYRVFCHTFCLLLLINGLLTCLRGPQGRLVPQIGSPSVNEVYLLTLLTFVICSVLIWVCVGVLLYGKVPVIVFSSDGTQEHLQACGWVRFQDPVLLSDMGKVKQRQRHDPWAVRQPNICTP